MPLLFALCRARYCAAGAKRVASGLAVPWILSTKKRTPTQHSLTTRFCHDFLFLLARMPASLTLRPLLSPGSWIVLVSGLHLGNWSPERGPGFSWCGCIVPSTHTCTHKMITANVP